MQARQCFGEGCIVFVMFDAGELRYGPIVEIDGGDAVRPLKLVR